MTLVNVNPTILEECQLCMHVDHEETILCDSYIVEFEYDPTCNYYERGKYSCRKFSCYKITSCYVEIAIISFRFLAYASFCLP